MDATHTTSDDPAQAFKDAMAELGVVFDGAPIMDGKLHRVDIIGRRKGTKHGWFVGYLDGIAAGAFGDYKAGLSETWCQKRPERMSDDERRALRERMEAARKEREAALARVQAEARDAAAAIWKAAAKASAEHPYLARKGIPPLPGLKQLGADVRYVIDGERKTARAGVLVVPLFRPDGTLASVQLIDAEGVKRFLKGTEKAGSYTSIGKPPSADKPVILIGEGYATCAQVHRATGALIVAAFDAGNLEPVAKAIRAKYPAARIIIAADNDAHTRRPDGTPWNPGLESAIAAARAVKGRVAVPLFPEGDLTSTDFDDLARLEGLDAVKATLRKAVRPDEVDALLEEHACGQAPDEAPPHDAVPEGPEEAVGEIRDLSAPPENEAPAAEEWSAPHFRCLGVDGTTFFYQPARVAQIIELGASAHTETALLRLAPLHWWESTFPKKGGCDWASARNACIRSCVERGMYNPASERGRGVYLDAGRVVAHLGDRVLVKNGGRAEERRLQVPGSRLIYAEGHPISLGRAEALKSSRAKKLAEIVGRFPWAEQGMAELFAGWLVIAPVCGVLDWRSHAWVTGGHGSGKTTLLDKVALPALGGFAVRAPSTSTEAGLRQTLNKDALPVLMDESEKTDERSSGRIDNMIELARQASSGTGAIIKGSSAGKPSLFLIRSSFLFASINSGVKHAADESRTIRLELLPPPKGMTATDKANRKADFDKLCTYIEETLTADFAAGLFMRTFLFASTIVDNAKTIKGVIAKMTGNPRLGDTLSGPIAGWYSLGSSARMTESEAEGCFRRWAAWLAPALESNRVDDARAAVQYLLARTIRLDGGRERSIDEMISVIEVNAATSDEYSDALKRHGLRVDLLQGDQVLLHISNTHHGVRRLFQGSPFSARSLAGHAAVTPGAKAMRFSGGSTKFQTLDVSHFRAAEGVNGGDFD